MTLLEVEPSTKEEALTVYQGLTSVNKVLLGGNGRFALFAAVGVISAGVDDEELAHCS